VIKVNPYYFNTQGTIASKSSIAAIYILHNDAAENVTIVNWLKAFTKHAD
jgi:hypothetical protein